MLDYVQEFLEIRILIPQHNKPLCELARKGGRLLPHLQAGRGGRGRGGFRLSPPATASPAHPAKSRPSRKLAGRAPAPAQEIRFQSLGFSGVAHLNGRPATTLRGKWIVDDASCFVPGAQGRAASPGPPPFHSVSKPEQREAERSDGEHRDPRSNDAGERSEPVFLSSFQVLKHAATRLLLSV